jgi:hypothetical protein
LVASVIAALPGIVARAGLDQKNALDRLAFVDEHVAGRDRADLGAALERGDIQFPPDPRLSFRRS